ncbi:SHOCT domain-containing protein [Haloarculaceae archaeon H-GB11]|nr:SHOCT domain-containing protein [Haloarculaceae archaeon H-GB11]
MSLQINRLLWMSLFGMVASAVVSVVVVGYVGFVTVTTLLAGGPVLDLLLGLALPVVASLSVLLLVFVLSILGTGVGVARSVTLPSRTHLVDAAEAAERRNPVLAALSLSDRVAEVVLSERARHDRHLDRLKRRYVAGELNEQEFERRVYTVLDADDRRDAGRVELDGDRIHVGEPER